MFSERSCSSIYIYIDIQYEFCVWGVIQYPKKLWVHFKCLNMIKPCICLLGDCDTFNPYPSISQLPVVVSSNRSVTHVNVFWAKQNYPGIHRFIMVHQHARLVSIASKLGIWPGSFCTRASPDSSPHVRRANIEGTSSDGLPKVVLRHHQIWLSNCLFPKMELDASIL